MERNLRMPANYVEITAEEKEQIIGGASTYWIHSIINAIAGLFGAFKFSGSSSQSRRDSSSISSDLGGPGASSNHTEGEEQNFNWSFDGNRFFSSLASLINLFI